MAYGFSLLALLLTLLIGSVSIDRHAPGFEQAFSADQLVSHAASQQHPSPTFDPDVLLAEELPEIDTPEGSCERPLFIAQKTLPPAKRYQARAPPSHPIV